ncbi:MAG TPA: hypothetical protein VNE38_07735 [Ktedonobacteraceae bacterium]|nr:hypothetical protein [Ktedonobacteraceae bacterium]
MQYEEARDWRQLLGMIMQDARVKQRIYDELGVQTITLNRWVNGDTDPRPQNLKQLLNVLPEYREQFIDLLGDDYTEAVASISSDASRDIPSTFIASVLSAHANIRKELRFWSLGNLVIRQALGQLDPDRLGMAITIVRCMKSSHSPLIRSLRESVAYGTPPWQGNLEQQGLFLGAESLAGYCVTLCKDVENNEIRDPNNLLPAHQIEHELSAAASPILFSGKIAGCMLVSSTQPNYFLSQYRLSLIHNYANLIALAFEIDEFYDMKDVQLEIMPLHVEQRKHFGNFRTRVTEILTQNKVTGAEAEHLVWEELEEKLLKLDEQEQKQEQEQATLVKKA